MAREFDWALFEKAVDITTSAVRGTLGGENTQAPKFAADVFREVWAALKDAAGDLSARGKPGF